MSCAFKYKTAAALGEDAARLGLDAVRLQADLAPLRRPIIVAGRMVGNRLTIQPMEGCDGTLDGAPDDLTYRRYERFGAGAQAHLGRGGGGYSRRPCQSQTTRRGRQTRPRFGPPREHLPRGAPRGLGIECRR